MNIKIKEGYLIEPAILCSKGFKILKTLSSNIEIYHPCGQFLPLRKEIYQKMGLSESFTFKITALRKNPYREIWKIINFPYNEYEDEVYGELITNDHNFLDKELFIL